MKNYSALSLVVFLFFASFSFGQNSVSGTVISSNNKPIANALIYLDSINSNVKTDKIGHFEVMVPENVKYINVFSNKYGLLSAEYNGERKIDFIFINGKRSAKDRLKQGDKVSIGYNEVEKKYVAIKVESVNAEEQIDGLRFKNIYDLLRNRVAGVRVTSNNKIIIRGVNSMISSQDPLFVVDGSVVSTIDYILPVDVKSINVLKGPETSIYGTRGSNGVILIETKK